MHLTRLISITDAKIARIDINGAKLTLAVLLINN